METDFLQLAEQYGSVRAMVEELDDDELLDCFEQLEDSPEVLVEIKRRGLPQPLSF